MSDDEIQFRYVIDLIVISISLVFDLLNTDAVSLLVVLRFWRLTRVRPFLFSVSDLPVPPFLTTSLHSCSSCYSLSWVDRIL